MSDINLYKIQTSEAYAYKCWYNYHHGNSMNIDSDAMSEISANWSDRIAGWQNIGDDVNAYEISDEDLHVAYDNAQKEVKNKTDYEGGGSGGRIARGVGDAVAGAAGAVVSSTAWGSKLLGNVGANVVDNAANSASKLGQNTDKFNKVQDAGKNTSWLITAPLSLAMGILYKTLKPNEDEHKAAQELQEDILPTAQSDLARAQDDMEEADAYTQNLASEAEDENEKANDTIEEDKTEFDMLRESLKVLQQKLETGTPLREDEIALFNQLIPILEELGIEIQEVSDKATEVVSEKYDEMDDWQSVYDDSAETASEVEAITDYAESFDQNSRNMCIVESVAQGLNAASGTQAAIQAGRFAASGGWITAWAWAFTAMGATGAAFSGLGAAEQTKWAMDISNEIDVREMTQDLDSETFDMYDELIDAYDGYKGLTEDLELEMPDDLEIPQETVTAEVPGFVGAGGQNTAGSSAGTGASAGASATTPTNPTTQSSATGNTSTTSNAGNAGGANNNANETNAAGGENSKPSKVKAANPSSDSVGDDETYQKNMGNGVDYTNILNSNQPIAPTLITNNDGKVVLSKTYADAVKSVVGDANGMPFKEDQIPEIISKILSDPFDANLIKDLHSGKAIDDKYQEKLVQTFSGKVDEEDQEADSGEKCTQKAKRVVDFYYPIFEKAASNGWTDDAGELTIEEAIKQGLLKLGA